MSAFKTLNSHDPERVEDLLINAVETISTYWCDSIKPLHEGDLYDISQEDWSWEVTDRETNKTVTVTRANLESGLKKFKKVVPHQFRLWMNEDDDAIAADCFFQCVVLGDVIYG